VPHGSPRLGHVAPLHWPEKCHLSSFEWICLVPSHPDVVVPQSLKDLFGSTILSVKEIQQNSQKIIVTERQPEIVTSLQGTSLLHCLGPTIFSLQIFTTTASSLSLPPQNYERLLLLLVVSLQIKKFDKRRAISFTILSIFSELAAAKMIFEKLESYGGG
jgi:hypothetical protein